jgi:hypothetical protein
VAAGIIAFAVILGGCLAYLAVHPYHWTLDPVDLGVYRSGGLISPHQFVIKRLVLPGQHQSFDHERQPGTGAAFWGSQDCWGGCGGQPGPGWAAGREDKPGAGADGQHPGTDGGLVHQRGPAIVVYLIFQRYLVRGLTLGMGK